MSEPPNVLHWTTEEGLIHVETPHRLPRHRWEQLKRYIELIEPKDGLPPEPKVIPL